MLSSPTMEAHHLNTAIAAEPDVVVPQTRTATGGSGYMGGGNAPVTVSPEDDSNFRAERIGTPDPAAAYARVTQRVVDTVTKTFEPGPTGETGSFAEIGKDYLAATQAGRELASTTAEPVTTTVITKHLSQAEDGGDLPAGYAAPIRRIAEANVGSVWPTKATMMAIEDWQGEAPTVIRDGGSNFTAHLVQSSADMAVLPQHDASKSDPAIVWTTSQEIAPAPATSLVVSMDANASFGAHVDGIDPGTNRVAVAMAKGGLQDQEWSEAGWHQVKSGPLVETATGDSDTYHLALMEHQTYSAG